MPPFTRSSSASSSGAATADTHERSISNNPSSVATFSNSALTATSATAFNVGSDRPVKASADIGFGLASPTQNAWAVLVYVAPTALKFGTLIAPIIGNVQRRSTAPTNAARIGLVSAKGPAQEPSEVTPGLTAALTSSCIWEPTPRRVR